nr:MAG TPA: hypothetical protein [Caudoviricetes sp.]
MRQPLFRPPVDVVRAAAVQVGGGVRDFCGRVPDVALVEGQALHAAPQLGSRLVLRHPGADSLGRKVPTRHGHHPLPCA